MKYSGVVVVSLLTAQLINGSAADGQEMFGATLGNYSGVNGLALNPASSQTSKPYLDVNILAADLFLQNNFIYMDKHEYHLMTLFHPGTGLPSHPEEFSKEYRNFYIYDNQSLRGAYSQERINGPGAMLMVGNQSFAITTGIRSVISLKNAPYELANFGYLGLSYAPQQNINYQDDKPFKAGEMTWAEIGVSYANTFYSRGRTRISGGISLRRLFGYSAFYIKVNSVNYVVPNDSTVSVYNMNARYGFSLPFNYNNNNYLHNKLFNGHGFAGDIGIILTRLTGVYSKDYYTTLCSQQYADYKYRLGIALIDVGAILFNSNAEKFSIDDKSSYWSSLNKIGYKNINQFMDTISYRFYGSNTASYRGSSIYMWLPSALSVQFDYHYMKNIYLNASLIYGFDLSPASLSRPAEIAITPRYETRGLEASLPVSLYDWNKLRLGFALRYYYLTVGTEKLGEFFRVSNFTGMDFYFAIHYFIDKGDCPKEKQGCREPDYRIKSTYR